MEQHRSRLRGSPIGRKQFFLPGWVCLLLVMMPFRPCQAADFVTVKSVIDGETLQLSDNTKVRLIGIDVPASSKNVKLRDDMKSTEQAGPTLIAAGKNAAKFLRKLIEKEKIVVEYVREEKDKSGRRWAYVYFYLDPHLNMEIPETWYAEVSPETGERQLRVFLNATMIRAGYAQMKILPPNIKFQELFSTLQEEAKERKRGLWEEPPQDAAPKMKARNHEDRAGKISQKS